MTNVKAGKVLPYKARSLPAILTQKKAIPAPQATRVEDIIAATVGSIGNGTIGKTMPQQEVPKPKIELRKDDDQNKKHEVTSVADGHGSRSYENDRSSNNSRTEQHRFSNDQQQRQTPTLHTSEDNPPKRPNNMSWKGDVPRSSGWNDYDRKNESHSRTDSASRGSGGWDNYNRDSTSSASPFSSGRRSDEPPKRASASRWDNNEPNPVRERSYEAPRGGNGHKESSTRESGSGPSEEKSKHAAVINTIDYGDMIVKKVDLSASSSTGVDGLSDLPGYGSWKNAAYVPKRSVVPPVASKDRIRNSNDSHNSSDNSYTLNRYDLNGSPSNGVDGLADLPGYAPWKTAKYDSNSISDARDNVSNYQRNSSKRSSDYDRDDRHKRQRVDERHSSDRFNRSDSSQSSSMGRGRGKDRTLPAWMSQGDARSKQDAPQSALRDSYDKNPSVLSTSSPSSSVGRGRGRDQTKPAWMSNQDKYGASDSVDRSGRGNQDNVQSVRQTHDAVTTGGNDASRGRGRGRTLPAWMTNQDSTAISKAPESTPSRINVESGGNTKYGSTSSTVTSTAAEPRRFNTGASSIARNSSLAESSSAGRGRGRDRTMPSWMSKQEQSNASDSVDRNGPGNAQIMATRQASRAPNTGGYDASAQESRGRGRGRTLPAWMTNQDSNSTISKAPEPSIRSSNAESDRRVSNNGQQYSQPMTVSHIPRAAMGSSQGLGRGRGKDQTLPAWMTKK